jgi:urease accessory protein
MNDALFPIGGFAHSYGLETYIQRGLVRDASTAAAYLRANLRESFSCGDLLCAALAWDYGTARDLGGLVKLEALVRASKAPAELREAALKLGSRFARTMGALISGRAGGDPGCGEAVPSEEAVPSGEAALFAAYLEALTTQGEAPSHAAAYGVCCAALGIGRDEALEAYLYAQASAMVTCCVKTIPLSQTAGQMLLTGLFDLMETLLRRLPELQEEDLYPTAPGFDLRAMEHETLYSRLYMS